MDLIPAPTEGEPATTPASPAAPPALPYATARADRPGRGFAIALGAHLAIIGGVLLILHEHALRPPPPPTAVALVIEKPPPPPPAPKPPAPTPPVKSAAASLPMPSPPPPQPTKPPRPAASHLVKIRPPPPTPIKTIAATPGSQGQAHTPPATSPPRPAGGNPPPVYPYIAREQGDEGWVNLSVHVTASGLPDAATIIESSGHLLLDDEARQNVLQHWHFQPALQNGQPVASTIDLWFHFDLQDPSP